MIPGGPWTSCDQDRPVTAARPAELRTWVQAPALALLSALFMPCLVADFSQPVAARSVDDLKTYVHGPSPVAPGPPVIRNYDFPRPPAKTFTLDQKTWVQTAKPVAPGPPVIRQMDWPVPVAKVRPVDLGTWVQAPTPPSITYLPSGVTSFDYPQATRPVGLQTWAQSPPPAGVAAPFSNYDFPVPLRVLRAVGLQTWTSSPRIAAAVAAPFANYDFPVPVRASRSVDLGTWVQNPEIVPVSYVFREALVSRPIAARQANAALDTWTQGPRPVAPIVTAPPPANYDFPLPARRQPDRTWLQGFQTNLQGTVLPLLMPSAVVGWEVPPVTRPPGLDTWSQSPQPQQAAPGTPFATYDYPVPRRVSNANTTWAQSQQIAPPTSARAPTNYDYSIPQKAPRSVDLQTWTQGFQANLEGTVLALLMPGAVISWDNPQAPAQPPGTWLQSPQAVPAPAPVADSGSAGGGISGGYFSRKKWHVLIGEMEAERAQARMVKNAAHRKVVAPAALLATRALKAAREAEESAQVAADLRAMSSALQAAAGAKSLGIAIAQANEAQEFARSAMAAMIAWQEDQDDEEEAIALLLMH